MNKAKAVSHTPPFFSYCNAAFKQFVFTFLLFFLLTLCASLFAEEQIILVKKNEYGGKTIQYIYTENDHYYTQLESSTYYFDGQGDARRVIHIFNAQQSLLSGFSTQEERLENGSVLNFKMSLTPKQRVEQGIDYLIEYIDKDNRVIRKQYVKGEYSRTEATGTFTDSYPCYALDVLEKYLAEDETQEIVSDKAVYKFSADLNRGRSFVKFSSGIKGLSDKDKSLIAAYMDCYNKTNLTDLFVKKVEVQYGKQTYIAFIQEQLLDSIKKNKICFLSYGVLGCNNEMYLLITDVGDLD